MVKNSSLCSFSPQQRVFETSRTFCTVLENPDGAQRLGFVTEDGSIPNFMVIADLFGQKIAAWSSKLALIRELCACSYGAADAGPGLGSVLRSDIDQMSQMANCIPRANKNSNVSLVLVLSAPWGCGLGERFWRLFTFRKESDGSVVDSELVITSASAPPARHGRSVFEHDGRASKKQIIALKTQVRATCIDIDSPEDGPREFDHTNTFGLVQRSRYDIAMSLVRDLKSQLAYTKEQVDTSYRERDAQIQSICNAKVASAEEILNMDIACLYSELDLLRTELQTEKNAHNYTKVVAHVMEGDVEEYDEEISSFNGFSLLLKEEVHELRRLVKTTQESLASMTKKCASQTKKASETNRLHRTFQAKYEAILESADNDRTSLSSQIETLKSRLEESKRTTSVTLGHIYDARDKAMDKVDKTNETLRTTTCALKTCEETLHIAQLSRDRMMKSFVISSFKLLNSRRKASVARCALKFLRLLANRTKNQTVDAIVQTTPESENDAVAAATTTKEPTGTSAHSPMPTTPTTSDVQATVSADAVASAKACLATLQLFVERAQSSGYSPAVEGRPPSMLMQGPNGHSYVDESSNNNNNQFVPNEFYQHPMFFSPTGMYHHHQQQHPQQQYYYPQTQYPQQTFGLQQHRNTTKHR